MLLANEASTAYRVGTAYRWVQKSQIHFVKVIRCALRYHQRGDINDDDYEK